MNGSSNRDEIVRLESHIEELAGRIESCRKFILAGRIGVVTGGVALLAMLLGIIPPDPSIMGLAAAAVLGGIVAAGSNHSTAKVASYELRATEAKRAELIGQLELRTVPKGDGLSPADGKHFL